MEALPQRFLNGEVHDWYNIVHGYSDHLVANLLQEFKVSSRQRVLDAFCGAGTTLVECCKLNIDCVGIDANPSSCFAARVKTNWSVRPSTLLALIPRVADLYEELMARPERLKQDPTYRYLVDSGMIRRGWIAWQRTIRAIAVKRAIDKLQVAPPYRDALRLALMTEVVNTASNVRFGPELYCGKPRTDIDFIATFQRRVREMSRDLGIVRDMAHGSARVLRGDARDVKALVRRSGYRRFQAVICSPPYPAEHDYTRNSRLELAFLEAVRDRRSLQKIKRTMIRSHTKGVYKGDGDAALVKGHPAIERIARALDEKAECKTHGFARLYSTVVREYFGGMRRHLESLRQVLHPGALCAYVLGDQSSYLQVRIPTAEILSSLADELEYKTIEIRHWRSRWSTATRRAVAENILILKSR
jgi:hypothetical protein